MKVRDRVDYQGVIKKRLCEANQSVTVFHGAQLLQREQVNQA